MSRRTTDPNRDKPPKAILVAWCGVRDARASITPSTPWRKQRRASSYVRCATSRKHSMGAMYVYYEPTHWRLL
jgi:hypothetical protein